MKILYAIQGTGNGHISRARDIIPILEKMGELDLLISGTEADVNLPYPVKYAFKGLSFVFGKKGGIDLLATYKKGNLKRLYKEIKMLPVEEYDLIINDFEPVSAWAAKFSNVPCIGLSHQAAVINKKSPRPKKQDLLGKAVLANYAPVTRQFGFHFECYDKDIYTPVIRQQIRHAKPMDKGHYTVYLPAYDDKRIISILSKVKEKDIEWHVFSKHNKESFVENNFHVFPVNNELFIESLIHCKGMICGAGFETPAEAMFLRKKLLAIPMKGQYEQQCNAAALKKLGIAVIKSLKEKHLDKINSFLSSPDIVKVNYPDITEQVLMDIVSNYKSYGNKKKIPLGESPANGSKFRNTSLRKILSQIQE
jgi:uncharacterized protein (TIGR00661 family)